MTPPSLTGLAKRLVAQEHLSLERAQQAQTHASREGLPFATYLVEHHLVGSAHVAHAAADEFGLPLIDIAAVELDPEVTKLISEKLIRHFNALPVFKRGNRLFVAIADPANIQAMDQFQFHSGLTTEAVLAETQALKRAMDSALDSKDATIAALTDTDLDDLEFSGADDALTPQSASETDIDDAPLVRFVNKVLLDAVNKGASDIHFEPYEGRFRVRFRMDGLLREVATPPTTLAPRVALRLKVMARLDISERRMPQDGRIKMKLSRTRAIDFRVSTCPTMFGEKIVLRILDTSNQRYSADTLGLEPEQMQMFIDAVRKPYGMVLVTGPTGSGKTMTLYTALNILNTDDRNISSCEDPAEIYLPGINQVSINPKVGLTFASALRAFLRQDPDVIMIGEIRDAETAEIAVKAAQTGHMVLSTLHTNDAPQTLPRLRNMGVETYNIVSAVNLVLAQRLVRRLCDHCKQPVELSPEVLLAYGVAAEDIGTFLPYGPVGCEHCNAGYKGRVGVFQVMPVSDAIARIILRDGTSVDIAEQASREGIRTLRQSGLRKVAQGATSLEEITRMTTE